MANLNLSEFGEKLFVADADHTFIWDTAASISKRVSRNSWLSGTTADFHLGLADAATAVAQTISVQSVVAGTTNTAGANFSINGSQGTGTGAGGALLLRTAPAGSSGTAQNALVTAVAITSAGNVGIGTTSPSSKLHVAGSGPGITIENAIATGYSEILFKNTTATGTSIFLNGSAQSGYGGPSSLNIYSSNGPIAFHTASVTNALSIAQNGIATFAGSFNAAFASFTSYILTPAVYKGGEGGIEIVSDGVIRLRNQANNDFGRFQFGGSADTHPAIARDGAGIKFTGAAAGSTAWIKVPPVAVGSLPVAATAGAGARAFVNDASAPVFGTAVSGGGAVLVPVYCTGSAWNVG